MAYQACEDCGTRIYGGLCPNCQEEAYIFETQTNKEGFSDEFMGLVGEQQRARRSSQKASGEQK